MRDWILPVAWVHGSTHPCGLLWRNESACVLRPGISLCPTWPVPGEWMDQMCQTWGEQENSCRLFPACQVYSGWWECAMEPQGFPVQTPWQGGSEGGCVFPGAVPAGLPVTDRAPGSSPGSGPTDGRLLSEPTHARCRPLGPSSSLTVYYTASVSSRFTQLWYPSSTCHFFLIQSSLILTVGYQLYLTWHR